MPRVKLLDSRGNALRMPATVQPGRRLAARYDAAQLTHENRRHWAESDGLSAKAANSVEVRDRLRRRSRYEVANNSYARGIVESLANDTIGTGPRLQLLTENTDLNRTVEKAFACWADYACLAAKLRTMRKARAEDGEAFALFVTNPKIDFPIQLDLKLVEADQVHTPIYTPLDPRATDGIRFDNYGNPTEYHVLPYHPGDQIGYLPYGTFERVPADLVIHWFRHDRPGQLRGVPDITPALPLFAQLRRYTLAVIAAAETAADFAAVLESQLPPDVDDDDDEGSGSVAGEAFNIERRQMVTLPDGYKLNQLRAEQPCTNYEMFKHEILNEIARCLCMPFAVAAGNSAGYNYSSGRLDFQAYYKAIGIDQSRLEFLALNRILAEFLAEAGSVGGIIPGRFTTLEDWPHQWFWDGAEHVDPMKEAQASVVRINAGLSNLSIECAKDGLDYEVVTRQRARELALDEELGIVRQPPPGQPGQTANDSGNQPSSDGGDSSGDGTDGYANDNQGNGQANGRSRAGFAYRNGHVRP